MDKLGWNGHRGQLYMTGVKGKSGRKKGSLNKKTIERRKAQAEYNKAQENSATSPENVPTAICASTSDPSESKEAK